MKIKIILLTTIAEIIFFLSGTAFGAVSITTAAFSNGGSVGSSSTNYTMNDNIGQDIVGAGYSTNFNISAGRYNCVLDTDGDGMPDQWEVKYGLDPNDATGDNGASGDPDNDGRINSQEYAADTDPTDGESILKVSSISVSAGTGIVIGFPTSSLRSYYLYYSDNAYSNSMSWTQAGSAITGTGSTYSYTDDGTDTVTSPLNSSISYRYYKITATSAEGFTVSALDDVPGGVPATPNVSGLQAVDTPSDNGGSITLTWNAVSEEILYYYEIYRSTEPITEVSEEIFLATSDSNSYIDKTTTDGANYYYAATVVDINGGGSAEATAVGPVTSIDDLAPGDIRNFSAAVSDKQIILTWANPSDSDFCGVKIQRKTNGYPVDINDGTEVYNASGTSSTNSGLINGVAYYYTAFTYDEIPNYSEGINLTAVPLDNIPPATPAGFRITSAVGDGALNLAWNANTESDLAGYFLYYLDNQVNAGTVTEYQLTGLINGTAYSISISAYDTSGNESDKSSVITGTPGEEPSDTTPPAKVGGLSASDVLEDNGGSISLSWSANTEEDLNHYNIYRSADSITDVSGMDVLATVQVNSYIDNTTVDRTDYYYAVTAVDDYGNEDTEVTGVGPVSSMDNLYY